MKFGKWFFYKNHWVWKYDRGFYESNISDSRITYNPTTKVGELFYNIHHSSPINSAATQKKNRTATQRGVKDKGVYLCSRGSYEIDERRFLLFFVGIPFPQRGTTVQSRGNFKDGRYERSKAGVQRRR